MTVEILTCTQCANHKIVPDPDPHDWFCDDDCAVMCKLSEKKPVMVGSNYQCSEPMVTVACRPYNVDKETAIPSWCPLKKKD